ncbi:MAG: hypothetical protein J6W03_03155 [Bacteroidaceae bacterium]|nr:hypothetical protein [Bacteroidaceae bacterium]
MTLKLTLFSQEKEDFVREILIDSDAKFDELHQLILDECNYEEHEKQSFLICDEDWRVRQRICLMESEDVGYDTDINLMSETRIGDFLEDEGQRLAYVFDPDGKRFFLMELTENVFGRKEMKPIVNRKHGQAPDQILSSLPVRGEDEETDSSSARDDEEGTEAFYGDEGFEADELDMEGYEIDE